MTLSPLKKLIEESNSSPVKEHTKVISNFLETYKHRVLEDQQLNGLGRVMTCPSKTPPQELFERLEGELTAIVETFQRDRNTMRRENEQLRQMLQERDTLITQIQGGFHLEKERMLQQWQVEKNIQSQSIMTLKEDMQRLESDFESLKKNLTIRE